MSGKTVDLGFFNGDYKPWDLEKEFKDFELESRDWIFKQKNKKTKGLD